MILLTYITKELLQTYTHDFWNCLKHNSLNGEIKKIIVFSDHKINNIHNVDRVNFVFRQNLDKEDLNNYSTGPALIKSDPFVKFHGDLKKISLTELQKFVLIGDGFEIFSNSTKHLLIKKSEKDYKNAGIFTQRKKVSQKKSKINPLQTISKEVLHDKTPKLDVIIGSVNYNDYLILTLERNTKIFENITVFTTPDDTTCHQICEKFDVKYVKTNVMFESGAKFNKGRLMEFAINMLDNPEFILLLDADMIINEKIDTQYLEKNVLYTTDRYIIPDFSLWQNYLSHPEEVISQIPTNVNERGIGFFQLFHIDSDCLNKNAIYPTDSIDASWTDLKFRDKFSKKLNLDLQAIHLGPPYLNWSGRNSKKFLSDKEFTEKIESLKSFDINDYFDEIYCLNLDRRQDRWEKVKYQFAKNNIRVKRWSAIDGDSISDKIFEEYNPLGISGRDASAAGLVENKNALGCLLSHLEIIKHAKSKNFRRILIFEDDIMLSNDFFDRISMINNMDWKLLYLGASQFDWSDIKIQGDFYNCKKTLGTFAYAIDCSLFDEIIDSPKSKSIDNLLSLLQEKYYGQSFTLYPNFVISDVNNSDIRQVIDMSSYSKLMRWSTERFTFIKEAPSIIKKHEALDNLIQLDQLFRRLNVEYWITCGTLLGFYRDDDFIGHDKDTDICVNAKDFNGYVLKRILNLGFEITHNFGVLSDGFEISLTRGGVKTDIFLFYKTKDKWYNSVYADFTEKDCLKFDYVYQPFELSESVFLGYSFKTPKDIEGFLIEHYGDDFREPNKNWSWWQSPLVLKKSDKRIKNTSSKQCLNKLLNFDKSIYLKNITILIKSFLRKECVNNLIISIRKYYKDVKIIVVDDSDDKSYNFDFDKNIKTYNIEFDSGLSKGRNFGVSKIETEYFLLLDDDFEFTEETDIIKWMDIMIESNLDILGANVVMNGEIMEYFGNFEVIDGCLYYKNERYFESENYKTCDFILNFFIAKTDSIKEMGWDDELKLAEHTAFFFEHKSKLKVGYTEKVSINHQKVIEGDYEGYRRRGKSFFNDWMKKKQITKIVNLKGEIVKRK